MGWEGAEDECQRGGIQWQSLKRELGEENHERERRHVSERYTGSLPAVQRRGNPSSPQPLHPPSAYFWANDCPPVR